MNASAKTVIIVTRKTSLLFLIVEAIRLTINVGSKPSMCFWTGGVYIGKEDCKEESDA